MEMDEKQKRRRRNNILIFASLILAISVLVITNAFAQSPFGVGVPERTVATNTGITGYILQQQAEFHKSLIGAIRDFKESSWAFWSLALLSFLYGVFHAAGPGHGKAILVSYTLASGDTVKKGVALSFAAAMAQAVCAILLIGIAGAFLNMTSMAITAQAQWLELAGWGMLTVLGLVLVLRSARSFAVFFSGTPAVAAGHNVHGHHDHPHHHHDHDHCCGHDHGPDREQTETIRGIMDAIPLIVSIGLRPCTGAVIVLVFALANGVLPAGIFSAFTMALGTGLTVSLFIVAAGAGRATIPLLVSGQNRTAGLAIAVLKGAAALLVLYFGISLFIAAAGGLLY